MKRILLNGKEYREYEYRNETEFEKDVIANAKEVFGQNTIYVNLKKLLKAKHKHGSIPDGYLLDYTVNSNPRLYLVENELQVHSIRDHIAPQLVQFAFNYKHNFLKVKNIIVNYMVKNNIGVDAIAQKAGYRNADAMITDLIYNEKLGVIVSIDGISEELLELKSLFRFDLELLQFKKFINGKDCLYLYDKFNEEAELSNKLSIDTILVPAEEKGFKEEFLGNNRWYAVSIGINMLDKLKYIAVYQKKPVMAITHYAEIANIDLYGDTGKYIIYFKGDATELKRPIPLNKKHPRKAPQARVYTNIEKILKADSKTTLDDIF